MNSYFDSGIVGHLGGLDSILSIGFVAHVTLIDLPILVVVRFHQISLANLPFRSELLR